METETNLRPSDLTRRVEVAEIRGLYLNVEKKKSKTNSLSITRASTVDRIWLVATKAALELNAHIKRTWLLIE